MRISVLGIVAELVVDGSVVERRLAAGGIPRDPDAVRLVFNDLEATEPGRVVDGGRELAHPTAHVGREHSIEDRCFDEATFDRARPDGVVEGERLSGLEDRVLHQVRGAMDVRDARRAAWVVGRERGDLFLDAE